MSHYSRWNGSTVSSADPSLQSLRRLPWMRNLIEAEMYRGLHPKLRFANSTRFVLLYRSLIHAYQSDRPIKDPIFQANRQHPENANFHVPDYEATALACAEQMRFCIREMGQKLCQDWRSEFSDDGFLGLGSDNQTSRATQTIQKHLKQNLYDVGLLYYWAVYGLSVFRLIESYSRFLVAYNDVDLDVFVSSIDPQTQWVRELISLFEIAYLQTRLALLKGVQSSTLSENVWGPTTIRPEFCSSFLFRDGDYTNISLIWLLVVIVFCLLILIPSTWLEHEEVMHKKWTELLTALSRVSRMIRRASIWLTYSTASLLDTASLL